MISNMMFSEKKSNVGLRANPCTYTYWLVHLYVILFLCVCWNEQHIWDNPALGGLQEKQVANYNAEAVESLLKKVIDELKADKELFFLRVGKEDPDKDLITRFRGSKYRIRKWSNIDRTRKTRDDGLSYFDRESGEPGTLVKVGPITRVDGVTLKIRVVVLRGELIGWKDEYVMKLQDGRWVVSEKRNLGQF